MPLTKNNHWAKCLAFIFVLFSVTNVYAGQTVDEILDTYYPIHNETKQCRGLLLIMAHHLAKKYLIKADIALRLIDN